MKYIHGGSHFHLGASRCCSFADTFQTNNKYCGNARLMLNSPVNVWRSIYTLAVRNSSSHSSAIHKLTRSMRRVWNHGVQKCRLIGNVIQMTPISRLHMPYEKLSLAKWYSCLWILSKIHNFPRKRRYSIKTLQAEDPVNNIPQVLGYSYRLRMRTGNKKNMKDNPTLINIFLASLPLGLGCKHNIQLFPGY